MTVSNDDEPDAGACCQWCGGNHGGLCPFVKAMEFDPSTRRMIRVEFLTPADCVKVAQGGDPQEPAYETLKPGWKG